MTSYTAPIGVGSGFADSAGTDVFGSVLHVESRVAADRRRRTPILRFARQNSALTAGSISSPVLGTTRRCASVLETVWRRASTTIPKARPDLSGTVTRLDLIR